MKCAFCVRLGMGIYSAILLVFLFSGISYAQSTEFIHVVECDTGWHVAGPWYGQDSVENRWGDGNTTLTLRRGLYIVGANAGSVRRDGESLWGEPLDDDYYVLQVGRTQSRILQRNPEYLLYGEMYSAFYPPCGSMDMGLCGFDQLPFRASMGMLPGVRYWFRITTWSWLYFDPPYYASDAVERASVENQDVEPGTAIASNLTWVKVTYITPNGEQTWLQYGGGYYPSYDEQYVEVSGPPLQSLDPMQVSGWMLY